MHGLAFRLPPACPAAGLVPVCFQDLSRDVKQPGPIPPAGLTRAASRTVLPKFLFQGQTQTKYSPSATLTIWLAYGLGSMRYGILTALKPIPSAL